MNLAISHFCMHVCIYVRDLLATTYPRNVVAGKILKLSGVLSSGVSDHRFFCLFRGCRKGPTPVVGRSRFSISRDRKRQRLQAAAFVAVSLPTELPVRSHDCVASGEGHEANGVPVVQEPEVDNHNVANDSNRKAGT